VAGACPQAKLVENFSRVLEDPAVDAVVIATPVGTHSELALAALEAGKHVLVEKPMAASVHEAEEMVRRAEKCGRVLMVDHTFIYSPPVRKMKELLDSGELGDLYYVDSVRINLGLFQHDVNVVWDLAPHDLSVMDYVIKSRPCAITANGVDHFGRSLENIAYIAVYFPDNLIAHFNVNWLSPVKIRTTLIGGAKRMLVWNDLDTDEKIKIYDKGVTVKDRQGIYNLLVEYRSGDMWAPRVDHTEALRAELVYFVDCILKDKAPINDGLAGLRIIRMLEASDRSLKNRGKMIKL
jgi:predicted dehydrogenase